MKDICWSVIGVLFILLLPSACYGKNQSNQKKEEKIMTQQNNTYWSMEYAQKMLNESAHISYGIMDTEKFNQIVVQKNKGDPNALYVYGFLLYGYYNI